MNVLITGSDVRVPDCDCRDGAGNRHIALQQYRRNREDIAYVVEAIATVVHWKSLPGSHVERQEVTHGIAVLVSIEAMNGRMPGIQSGCGRAVEFAVGATR